MSDQFNGKKYYGVIQPKPEAAFKVLHTDLLVLSYMAYQASFGNNESASASIARGTGLGADTVASAKSRLRDRNLVVSESVTDDVELIGSAFSLLQKKRQLHTEKHWYWWMQNWTCYVRNPDVPANPLMPSHVSLYSYIRHCRMTSFVPKCWSYAYIGKVLCLDEETVKAGILKLKRYGFISDDMGLKPYRTITEDHLRLFANKYETIGDWDEGPAPIPLPDGEPPAPAPVNPAVADRLATLTPEQRIAYQVFQYMNGKPGMTQDIIARGLDDIRRKPDWQTRWKEYADRMLEAALGL